jgi:hypothetical protein
MNVLLIHPNVAGEKLAAEKELLEKLPPDVTAMDLESFAQFWRGRDKLNWSVTEGKSAKEAVVSVTATEAVRGITLEFQREISSADAGVTILPDKKRIVLPDLKTSDPLAIHVNYSR